MMSDDANNVLVKSSGAGSDNGLSGNQEIVGSQRLTLRDVEVSREQMVFSSMRGVSGIRLESGETCS